MSTSTESTVWDRFLKDAKELMGGTIFRTITEINMLIPDSILFGSLLLYFLTQNIAFGVFGLFIFETVLSHKLVSWVIGQTVGPSRSTDIQCRAGFKTPQFSAQRMFSHDSYPSYSVFSITAIGTYLMMATKEFSDTMNAMSQSNPEWSSRATVAYSFIGLFVAAFMIVRLLRCDSLGEIFMAFALALVFGVGFFYLNKAVFGEEAMNFLGLPYMVSKDSQGAPIYVCAAEKQETT